MYSVRNNFLKVNAPRCVTRYMQTVQDQNEHQLGWHWILISLVCHWCDPGIQILVSSLLYSRTKCKRAKHSCFFSYLLFHSISVEIKWKLFYAYLYAPNGILCMSSIHVINYNGIVGRTTKKYAVKNNFSFACTFWMCISCNCVILWI